MSASGFGHGTEAVRDRLTLRRDRVVVAARLPIRPMDLVEDLVRGDLMVRARMGHHGPPPIGRLVRPPVRHGLFGPVGQHADLTPLDANVMAIRFVEDRAPLPPRWHGRPARESSLWVAGSAFTGSEVPPMSPAGRTALSGSPRPRGSPLSGDHPDLSFGRRVEERRRLR
jgi:hypothetical protein